MKVKNKNIYSKILEIIYPPKCGICGKFEKKYLCKKCEIMLKSQSNFKIEKNTKEIKNYENHLYFFVYGGIIRKIILNYKFKEKSYLYKTLTKFLINNKKFFEKIKMYDKIIPVPVSIKREKNRGYNQCLLIAKELEKQIKANSDINIECITDCIMKNKDIIEQSKLNKEDREKNIQGVYTLINKEKIQNKRILLIDDIYTTGSTVNECCKILQQAKPTKIDVFTIAKD